VLESGGGVLSLADRALKIWTYAQRAAIGLAMLEPELATEFPRVLLGCALSEELVRELSRIAGRPPELYRFQGEDSLEWVRYAFKHEVGRVTIDGFGQRPATEADAALPWRGGRA
jgi:hypothetical protein